MAVILTDEELENLCYYLATTEYIYYQVATQFFSDLYNTGARPAEAVDQTLWVRIDIDTFTLNALKGNNPRTIQAVNISPSLTFAIDNNIRPYDALSLRQLTDVLKKILPLVKVFTTDKNVMDYLFRYNKAKQLHIAGQTDPQLQSYFGWTEPNIPAVYYNQILYRIGPPPPEQGDRIIDYDGTFIIDDAGNYLN